MVNASQPAKLCAILAAAVSFGCSPERVVEDTLSANNPSLVEAPVGVPPVRMDMLLIAPTPAPPTATARVAPDPILPKREDSWENRRLPPGVSPGTPAQRPAGHEGPVEAEPMREPSPDPETGGGAR